MTDTPTEPTVFEPLKVLARDQAKAAGDLAASLTMSVEVIDVLEKAIAPALLVPGTFTTVTPTESTVPIPPTPIVTPQLSDKITDYMRMDGDQIIDIPDGEYSCDDLELHRAKTDGRFGGWLILRAENPGQARIVQGENPLRIQGGSAKVMLQGFKTDDGLMRIEANDVCFVDHDGSFHHTVWAEQNNWPGESGSWMANGIPGVAVIGDGSANVSFLGCDIHDTGVGINYEGWSGRDSLILGAHIWNIAHGGSRYGKVWGHPEPEPEWFAAWLQRNPNHPIIKKWIGFDPLDRLHGSAISNSAGGANNLEIGFFDIHDNAMFRDSEDPRYTSEPTKGLSLSTNHHNTTGVRVHDGWIRGMDHSMQIRSGLFNGREHSFTDGLIERVNVWDCGDPERTDILNDANGAHYRTNLEQWNRQHRNLQTMTTDWNGQPADGAISPAQIWRAQNTDMMVTLGFSNG